jgi:predicted Rossmann fold nucleotide-binding protein DprA/Smf involved in DNA uptake
VATEIRLAIVGSSKSWTTPGAMEAIRLIDTVLDRYQPQVVITGGAPGVDSWAAREAGKRGIAVIEHRPANKRWKPHGFEERNLLIANDCTHLVCIRSSASRTYGSGWTADRAEELGKPVWRCRVQS